MSVAATAAADAPLLDVAGLKKAYRGVQAVRGISFALARGEILAMIGPNGAGKSTCFNMLNGQVRPDGGTIRLAGRDVTGASPRAMWARGVGRTFQITATFSSMTVRENVVTALLAKAGRLGRMIGVARDACAGEALALLALVDLASRASGRAPNSPMAISSGSNSPWRSPMRRPFS